MRSYRLAMTQGEEQSRLVLLDADAGDRRVGEREIDPASVEAFITSIEAEHAKGAPQLTWIGDEIGRWLDGPAERWIEQLRGAAEGVSLHVDAGDHLRLLPWELARHEAAFLCADRRRPILPVRRARSSGRAAESPANRPLRVLFMAAAPEEVFPALDHDREEAHLLEAARSEPLDLVVEESGTQRGLHERILAQGGERLDALHLTGHAELRADGPRFLLEDDVGRVHAASAADLAAAVDHRWPRLIVLSACSTAADGAGGVPSLCEALVKAGAPAVLGWALPVGDWSATEASAELYAQLASGTRLDCAVASARLRLVERTSSYWHALRLYADATPLGALVTPEGTKDRARLPTRQARRVFLEAGSRVEVCEPERFVGRRRVIQRCLRALRSRRGDDGYAGGLLLHGVGGLGKSSLAARICDRMRETHTPIVWTGRIDAAALMRGATRGGALRGPDRPAPLDGIAPLVRELVASRSALVVLDDFEQNLERDADLVRVKPDALAVLRALLDAIHETSSESRVIVTSRWAFTAGNAPERRMHGEAIEALRGSELLKKRMQLGQFRPGPAISPSVHDHALALAGGNPRLLEHLDRMVAACTPQSACSLELIERTVDDFRDEQALAEVVASVSRLARRVLATLALIDLPIGLDAVASVTGEPHPPLDELVRFGLVEAGVDPESRSPRYAVSTLVRPLVEAELSPPERAAVHAIAARALHAAWWRPTGETTLERALEVHRLARCAADREIAAEMCAAVAREWVPLARYREVMELATSTLSLGEDYRVLHVLARAEHALGEIDAAAAHFDAALAACPEAGDHEILLERAALLHNTADLLAHRGHVDEAVRRWRASLDLHERAAEPESRAYTLDRLAFELARQGELTEAFQAWSEAIPIFERLGNQTGLAAALSNSAGFIAQQGDVEGALERWQRALALQRRNGDEAGSAASLDGIAGIEARRGRIDDALARWREATIIREMVGDVEGEASTLNNMAGALYDAGRWRKAVALWKKALALFDRLGDIEGRATVLASLASASAAEGRVNRAQKLWVEALALFEQLKDIGGQASVKNDIASVFFARDHTDEALALWQEALALYEQLDDVEGRASVRANIAAVLMERGPEELDRAIELLRGALAEFERMSEAEGIATTLGNIGTALLRLGRPEEARAYFEQSLARHREREDPVSAAATLTSLAILACWSGEHERERAMYREAIVAYVSVGAWLDVASTLEDIDGADAAETRSYRAQGFWLCLRVEVSADQAVRLAEALVTSLGPAAAPSPRIAAAALALAQVEGSDAPALERRCRSFLRACADAQGVAKGRFRAWLTEHGLLRRGPVMAAVVDDLAALVPNGAWLFERAAVDDAEPDKLSGPPSVRARRKRTSPR